MLRSVEWGRVFSYRPLSKWRCLIRTGRGNGSCMKGRETSRLLMLIDLRRGHLSKNACMTREADAAAPLIPWNSILSLLMEANKSAMSMMLASDSSEIVSRSNLRHSRFFLRLISWHTWRSYSSDMLSVSVLRSLISTALIRGQWKRSQTIWEGVKVQRGASNLMRGWHREFWMMRSEASLTIDLENEVIWGKTSRWTRGNCSSSKAKSHEWVLHAKVPSAKNLSFGHFFDMRSTMSKSMLVESSSDNLSKLLRSHFSARSWINFSLSG